MLRVNVVTGDVTQEPSDALITAVNSGGMWFGGIDGAIMRAAGDMFHRQAAAEMPLDDGDTVFAPALDGHRGLFGSVIFVVDDLQRPLSELVLTALTEANSRGCRVVTLPTLRTGVMSGAYEKTVEEALDQITTAISLFKKTRPAHVEQLKVVVFNDPASASYLTSALSH
jgi:O-acetyl-ADP-ribose deacetylase (regulator of RNase III)